MVVMYKLILIMLLVGNNAVAQRIKAQNYLFRIKYAIDLKTHDTLNYMYQYIELSPKEKRIVITYKFHDREEFVIKEDDSTYKNNLIYGCRCNGIWYVFTFIKIDEETYYLNVEAMQLKLDLKFLLKTE